MIYVHSNFQIRQLCKQTTPSTSSRPNLKARKLIHTITCDVRRDERLFFSRLNKRNLTRILYSPWNSRFTKHLAHDQKFHPVLGQRTLHVRRFTTTTRTTKFIFRSEWGGRGEKKIRQSEFNGKHSETSRRPNAAATKGCSTLPAKILFFALLIL